MKKIFSVLTLLLLAFSFQVANARNLSAKDAQAAAANCFSYYAQRQVDASQLTLVYQNINPDLGIPSCYYFNVEGGGWIIMSATTAADPVVAYNDKCSINEKAMPSNARWWLESYNELLVAVQNADEEQHFDDLEEWTAIMNETFVGVSKDDPIHVLMSEEWNQGYNSTIDYNLYSPVVDGERCPVGCVATALSQIFHYYRFPVKPRGQVRYTTSTHNLLLTIKLDTVTFDYSKMPNFITTSTTLEQAREMSKLGYCVGLAMGMDYTPEGSGAHSENVPTYMNAYFKYKKGTLIRRNYDNSDIDTSFINQIRRELKRQRPVYMSGTSSIGSGPDAGGHAWVCCGYRDDRPARYYMNWGWGPGYDMNGWYNLETNNMRIERQNYNFNLNQRAIIGLVPPADSTHIDIMGIADVENTAELLPAYPNPAAYTVTVPYMISSDAVFTVYSIDGKLVERRTLSAADNAVTIDVKSLPAGVYVYRLGGASGKFMVQ
jgi:hypothetical protein